jgi:TonB-dependent receptor
LRAGTALALVALFAGTTAAEAQAPAEKKTEAKPADSTVIVITGQRASQRSSIDRKKNAKTATDSIVAEDIGQFPDKNVNEAVSRVAGISLDRGDNGEGQGFSLRGQGMEQTLVDIDGQSVLNSNGALSGGAQAGTGGRAADLRELPADMVKSIDVVKGSTAAMQEGGLGGSVHIETRTGLDFKKPFFQLTVDQQQDSTTRKWTPEWSAVFARKFMGGRLGMVGNINYSETETTSDAQQPQTSGNSGPFRNADFDQSANKTFTYNPALVDPTATAANVTTPGYASYSPIDIVKKSAAANTKADCYAAFPALTSAQLTAIGVATGGTASQQTANKNTAQTEQQNELASCLNQWNDYAPSLIRYFSKNAYERRLAAQVRFDYRVNDDLTLYATANIKNRTSNNRDDTLNLGSPAYNQTTVAIQGVNYTASTAPAVSTTGPGNIYNTPRTVSTGLGFGFYGDGAPGCATTTSGTGTAQTTTGCGVESDITNATVDATHHLTAFSLNDANVNVDAIHYHTLVTSWGAQVGGHYKHDNVKLDFFYGDSGSTFERAQLRTAVNYTYGKVDMHVTDSGLWAYTLPSGFDISSLPYSALTSTIARNAGSASTVSPAAPAYSLAQAAQWGTNFNITWRPVMSDDHEKQLKWDLTYNFDDKIPFLTDVQWGVQSRNHRGNGWSGGGYTVQAGKGNVGDAGYVAPIVVPSENLTVNYRDCMPTSTSTQSCQYGYTPSSVIGANNNAIASLNNGNAYVNLTGQYTYTPTQLADLIKSALYAKPYAFMGDNPDKGDVISTWPLINPDVIAAAMTEQKFDLSCMKTCKANDGKVYEQPHFAYREKTNAMYLMFEFEQKLPWNMLFNGNWGERVVRTDVEATGFMTLQHTAVTSLYNPVTNPNAVVTTSIATNTSLVNHTMDWLPSYNLNLWVIPDQVRLTYYSAHVMSRPNPGALLPSGTCTIDERNDSDFNTSLTDDTSNACTGRVGNPALKPYKAINHNETIEWYPNKDINFSLGYFYNNVYSGAPIAANLPASSYFAGSTATDPVTGKPFSSFDFTVPSYVNQTPGLQRGIEFSTKMAFTILPWALKYTGVDFNYSKLSTANYVATNDLVTGAVNPPQFQRAFTENLALWYDDGRFNARVTYQGQAGYFDFISSCSNAINNYPTSFPQCNGQTIRTPYNPGGSNFRDKTGFVDMKFNYKVNKNLQIFFQGRNVTRALVYREIMPNNSYASGTPMLENISYGGARWQVGFTWRN